MPIAISPEQRALQASIREWAHQASTIALVRRLEPGSLLRAGSDEPGHRAAVRKLVGVAHRQAVAETALTLCGPAGAASDGPAAGAVHAFLLSRCLSIAGGTSQIMLNVVAERALGLPREEAR